jgi:hypothetical protein
MCMLLIHFESYTHFHPHQDTKDNFKKRLTATPSRTLNIYTNKYNEDAQGFHDDMGPTRQGKEKKKH